MPELPEVETVMRGLESSVIKHRIIRTHVTRKNIRFPLPDHLVAATHMQQINAFQRIGKYILAHLSNNQTILLHLGMSGRIRIESAEAPIKKHDHVLFDTDHGQRIVFHDPRRFGVVDLVATGQASRHPLLVKMGPDPFSNLFSPQTLADAFKNRKTPVKIALLNQHIVAGIGNIYASEALFEAGIDPRERACDIPAEKFPALYHAILNVLQKAINSGGSSLRDYHKTDGSMGYFQHQFSVYDKEGAACPACECDVAKTGGITKIIQSGRSTFYCPRKQG